MLSSRPGIQSISMPSFTGRSRAFIDSTKVTYSSSPSWALSSQNGWRHTSSASRKRYTCSENPSSVTPRPAATSR